MSRRSLLLLCVWLLMGVRIPGWGQGTGTGQGSDGAAPTLISVQGTVTVRRAGTVDRTAVRTMRLTSGDSLFTGPTGRVTILFPDGSQVKLNRASILQIPATAPARDLPPRLDLFAGELFARISPGRRLSIETPAAVAGMRGTELNLALTEEGAATLTVGEGEVSFANPQGSVTVREGQQSVARPGQAPTVPVAVNVPFIIEWTNDVQPVALLLETTFVSQDPDRLAAAQREAEALPPGAERERRLGDVRHDRGELREALAAYESALQALGPDAPASERAAVEARLGQTHLELGQVPEAEAAFRRSLEREPAGAVARAGLVQTLLSRRENQAALSEARAGRGRDPASAAMLTALALAQIRSGERDAALRSLEQAMALQAEYAPAHAWRSFLLRAAGRLDEANQAARRAVTLAPFSSLARQSLSDAEFALGRVSSARREAERAVALNPLSPGTHVSLGRALLQEGRTEAALREANKAVALDPDLERARFFRGVVLAQQRRLGAAERELERAVELDPGYLEARAFLARVYLEQGRRAEAIQVAQAAIERDPAFAPARGALGQVYWRAGRMEEAAAEYRRALELSPGSLLYHLELARVYLDQNNLPDALAEGLAASAAAPESSEAHTVLGLVYDRMNNREQAVREYREAILFSPENALARFQLGFSDPRLGISQREFTQALLRDPSVLSLAFDRPAVTTEITPGLGSHESSSLAIAHRDLLARGKLHHLSAVVGQRSDNYRDDRPERVVFAATNLAAAPNHRTHVLGQYLYAGTKSPLPGPISNPDRDDRAYGWANLWDLSTRYAVDPSTFVWLRGAHRLFHFGDRNPESPRDLNPIERRLNRSSDVSVEARVDHHWGPGAERSALPSGGTRRSHATSYTLFAARARVADRFNIFDPGSAAFGELTSDSRLQTVLHTLQDDYRPGSRLALILGLTAERFTGTTRAELPNGAAVRLPDIDETSWLPFGQATYLLTRRDLLRLIVHERRQRLVDSILQPADAFLVGEVPSVSVLGRTTLYELDYERRFSPRAFARLFLFRSDVNDFSVSPAVGQTVLPVGFVVPEALSEGVGLRYEQQIGRFLSSYLRYTYSEVTDRTTRSTRGRQLPMNPRSRAVLSVNYVDRAGTKLLVEADWIGKMYVDPIWSDNQSFDPRAPRPEFPDKLVVDLQLARERTVRREWVFRINNLFNAATIYWPGFPQPGRTYQLQYFIRF